jgi:hypothetical protein
MVRFTVAVGPSGSIGLHSSTGMLTRVEYDWIIRDEVLEGSASVTVVIYTRMFMPWAEFHHVLLGRWLCGSQRLEYEW